VSVLAKLRSRITESPDMHARLHGWCEESKSLSCIKRNAGEGEISAGGMLYDVT